MNLTTSKALIIFDSSMNINGNYRQNIHHYLHIYTLQHFSLNKL